MLLGLSFELTYHRFTPHVGKSPTGLVYYSEIRQWSLAENHVADPQDRASRPVSIAETHSCYSQLHTGG